MEIMHQLKNILSNHFSDDDLRELCFDLRIDYENIPGATKNAKIRELLFFAERREIIDVLIQTIKKHRPNISWPKESSLYISDEESFPYQNWQNVTNYDWQQKIVGWFKLNFKQAPNRVVSLLLAHIFEIIRASSTSKAPLHKVMELAKVLQTQMTDTSSSTIYDLGNGRDVRILQLIELGLHRQHSHIFMVPQVYKSNLLGINEYSSLLLATKKLASGDYSSSIQLVENISRGCPLASYIISQGYRKQSAYQLAHTHLEEGLIGLNGWSNHKCPFNWEFEVICNDLLLRATFFRAKGVIFRKEGEGKKAEENYLHAETLINQAIEQKPSLIFNKKGTRLSNDAIWVDYDVTSLHGVKADVCFSHGYYWYSQKDYSKATRLFQEAINALEEAEERWDSPYTRLAIIQLCQGNFLGAQKTFTKAHILCGDTPIEKNREAPLSDALCQLGLRVIELCDESQGRLTFNDPIQSLRNALDQEPKLTSGPLECHRDDAQHMLVPKSKPAHKIINIFIRELELEIEKL